MIFKLCILSLVFASAFAGFCVDLWRAEELTRETGRCLVKNNVTRAVVEMSDEKAKINSNFIKSYVDLLAVGIKDIDASIIVLDRLNPEQVCNNVAANLPAFFTGIVWLNVLKGDALWTDSIENRMSYLEGLVNACSKFNIRTGISTSPDDWESTMGDVSATSTSLTKLPLWYDDNHSNNQDFHDYNTFGGWNTPAMKEFQIDQFLCDMYISGYNHF